MPRRLLFELVSPGDLLGTVTPEAADATGIPSGLPVYATANDKAVEALGCGLRDEDTVLLSLGTYIAAMTTGTDPDGSDDDDAQRVRPPRKANGHAGCRRPGRRSLRSGGSGMHLDWDTAVAQMVAVGEEFKPDPATVETYPLVRQTYSGLREFTDPLFEWTQSMQRATT